jgi:hypothetical protein
VVLKKKRCGAYVLHVHTHPIVETIPAIFYAPVFGRDYAVADYPQSSKSGELRAGSAPLDQPVLLYIDLQLRHKLVQVAVSELGWQVKLGSALARLRQGTSNPRSSPGLSAAAKMVPLSSYSTWSFFIYKCSPLRLTYRCQFL